MDKVQLMTICTSCRGVTYLTATTTTGEGNLLTTYQPCHACRGSGIQLVWIDLKEFARMLVAENPAPKKQEQFKSNPSA